LCEVEAATVAKRKLALSRPIAFIDLETTGFSPVSARIVEIGVLKIMPDGRKHQYYATLDPQLGIPPEATNVHGITNDKVSGKPNFKEVAPRLAKLLTECDFAGFNIISFDLPFLHEEFRRAGVPFSLENRKIVDVKNIYHLKERRDLSAAYKFYCGADHETAHSAFEDARVCWKVLEGQIDRYEDLPDTVDGLSDFGTKDNKGRRFLDSGRWFETKNSKPHFAKGKYSGKALEEIARTEPDYLDWMLGADIPEDTALLVARAMRAVESR
jgi:DNA polymerase III subunit epsilon